MANWLTMPATTFDAKAPQVQTAMMLTTRAGQVVGPDADPFGTPDMFADLAPEAVTEAPDSDMLFP